MNGRAWTGKDVWQLMSLAEQVSQKEAAARLGRSVQAVNSKAKMLGFKWRQGLVSIFAVARRLNCSPQTAALAARGFGFKRVGTGNGRRFMLSQEQADWLEERLKHRLEKNRQQREAGRERTRKCPSA